MADEMRAEARRVVAKVAWEDGCREATRDDILRRSDENLALTRIKASVAVEAVYQVLSRQAAPEAGVVGADVAEAIRYGKSRLHSWRNNHPDRIPKEMRCIRTLIAALSAPARPVDGEALRKALEEILEKAPHFRSDLGMPLSGTSAAIRARKLLASTPAPAKPVVTEEMVERGAKAMAEDAGKLWIDLGPTQRTTYKSLARACLTAGIGAEGMEG